MKTFIFKLEFKKSTYGSNVVNTVYRVKNNIPVLLGKTYYNTNSYRGHDHEALKFLVENKHLPKKCSSHGGYINFDERGKSFKLIEI